MSAQWLSAGSHTSSYLEQRAKKQRKLKLFLSLSLSLFSSLKLMLKCIVLDPLPMYTLCIVADTIELRRKRGISMTKLLCCRTWCKVNDTEQSKTKTKTKTKTKKKRERIKLNFYFFRFSKQRNSVEEAKKVII